MGLFIWLIGQHFGVTRQLITWERRSVGGDTPELVFRVGQEDIAANDIARRTRLRSRCAQCLNSGSEQWPECGQRDPTCQLCGFRATYGTLAHIASQVRKPESKEPKRLYEGQWFIAPALDTTTLVGLHQLRSELGNDHVRIETTDYSVNGAHAQTGHRLYPDQH